MTKYVAVGFLTGLLACLIIGSIIRIIINKKCVCKFDERQKAVQGEAYKYSFYCLIIIITAIGVYNSVFPEMMIEPFTMSLLSIVISITLYVVFAIWNDAYFGYNFGNKKNVYLILFALAAVLNIVVVVMELINDGSLIRVTKSGLYISANFIVIIMIAIIFASIFAKKIYDKKTMDGE